MMKKMLFACCVLIQILAFSACKEKENSGYQVSSVSIRLVYPEGNGFEPVEGVSVTLKNTSGSTTFSQSTNAEGVAVFEVPQGIYEASAFDKRVADAKVYLFNGLNTSVNVTQETVEATIKLEMSSGGSVLIKELYVGAVRKTMVRVRLPWISMSYCITILRKHSISATLHWVWSILTTLMRRIRTM